jgi:hypothetical protein
MTKLLYQQANLEMGCLIWHPEQLDPAEYLRFVFIRDLKEKGDSSSALMNPF